MSTLVQEKPDTSMQATAPPLLSEQLKLGRLDAVLTFWNFAARLDADGFVRVIDMADVMAASSALVVTSWTKDLSILTVLTGKCLR